MRKFKEILKEEKKYADRVWYERHQLMKDKILKDGTPKHIVKGAFKSAKKVEKQYGKKFLTLSDDNPDFEWGMINGKLSTLRWILGEDWDELYT